MDSNELAGKCGALVWPQLKRLQFMAFGPVARLVQVAYDPCDVMRFVGWHDHCCERQKSAGTTPIMGLLQRPSQITAFIEINTNHRHAQKKMASRRGHWNGSVPGFGALNSALTMLAAFLANDPGVDYLHRYRQ